MVTASGVKLLDFGLAKFAVEPTSGLAVSQVTTVVGSQPLTQEGTILGTVRYMAPEQLDGKEADARTDLYALCVVLYEMVTGKWLFDGRTQASVIAAILKDRPRPLTDVRPLAPALLDRVVQTGLDKEPDRRWESARELKHALEWSRQEQVVAAPTAVARVAWVWKGLVPALALALIAALAVLAVRGSAQADEERRLEIWTGDSADPTGFAVSPDGRRLTYVASGPAGSQLWLRSFDADRAESLDRTEGASHPFWSPDGQSIGFFAERQLKRIDLVSRVTTTLAAASPPFGGTWGTDGILFTPGPGSTVFQIPASGGEPTLVLEAPGGKLFPVLLDRGPAFLFRPLDGSATIHLARLGSQDSGVLLRNAAAAALHPSGYMLFVRQGALLAQRFDPAAGALVGNEIAITDGMPSNDFGQGTALSVSASGVVAYRRGQNSRRLDWFDRSGRQTGQAAGGLGNLRWPAISAQGRIAVSNITDGQTWLIETGASTPTQFTFSPGGKYPAIWSPDGLWLAFASFADGSLRRKRSNGVGDEEVLLPEGFRQVTDWSPNGSLLLLFADGNLEVLSMEVSREPRPYLANPDYLETRGVFSPNGNWVAYESNESGRFEIYVRPFPEPAGGQSKVSTNGGSFARWNADGRELYYLSSAGVLMAVPVDTGGDVFTFGPAQELFRTRIPATEMNDVVSPYDVSPDGRFLMRVAGEAESRPITVVLNWSPE